MRIQLSIRDWLWLCVVIAIGIAWYLDSSSHFFYGFAEPPKYDYPIK